ncbi:Origin recognition complex subunit 3 [Rhodotorula kratochvilovae]
MDTELPFSEPFASTSRAVFTLPYKPGAQEENADDDFADSAALELYEQAWSTCSQRIQSTLSSLHDASLDQIVAFVRSSPNDTQSLYAALSGQLPLRSGLIIGASPGSSSLLYSSLTRQLTHPTAGSTEANVAPPHRSCIVSRLASRDCSNIKNALRCLIGGFVGSDIEIEADDEDEDDEVLVGGPATLKSALIVPEDLTNLKAWYEHRFGKKDSEEAPTLVVLLEDLEAMDGKVLTQMIDALACYTDTLPLTLLIGIATTADAFFSLVPRPTANKLDAARFFVDPGVSAFNALIRGLFVDWQAPLALAPKAYTDLWRTFEDLHHSIDATISFIQYLYMSHFTTQPYALLTLPPSPALLASLPPSVAPALRALPSVTSAPALAGALLDPSATPIQLAEEVSTARGALDLWHAERSGAFEALLACMEFWEKRKPMEGCLALLLGEQAEGEMGRVVDGLCGLVLQASSTKLPSFLRCLLSRLSAFSIAHPSTPPALSTFLASQLSALEAVLAAPRPAGRSTLFNTNLGVAGALGMGVAVGGGAGDADKRFSAIAEETAEGLKTRLRHALRPPTDLLLHELWFTADSAAMKRLYPTPLPTLLRTLTKLDPLSDPSYVPPSDGAPGLTPHDLGVAWRVYRETHAQGRLANLGEWWAGWELGAAEEEEEGERGGKRAREEDGSEEEEEEEEDGADEGPARRKHARFLRAVGDLAQLGFVHPSTYKPEHVLKSVY